MLRARATFIAAGCGSGFKLLDLSFEDVWIKLSVNISKERSAVWYLPLFLSGDTVCSLI